MKVGSEKPGIDVISQDNLRPLVNQAILVFVVTSGVPPSILNNHQFMAMVKAIAAAGPTFKPTERHALEKRAFGSNDSKLSQFEYPNAMVLYS